MTRTAVGWIPSPVALPEGTILSDHDDVDGLSRLQLSEVRIQPDPLLVPLSEQQAAESQATVWGDEWLVGHE